MSIVTPLVSTQIKGKSVRLADETLGPSIPVNTSTIAKRFILFDVETGKVVNSQEANEVRIALFPLLSREIPNGPAGSDPIGQVYTLSWQYKGAPYSVSATLESTDYVFQAGMLNQQARIVLNVVRKLIDELNKLSPSCRPFELYLAGCTDPNKFLLVRDLDIRIRTNEPYFPLTAYDIQYAVTNSTGPQAPDSFYFGPYTFDGLGASYNEQIVPYAYTDTGKSFVDIALPRETIYQAYLTYELQGYSYWYLPIELVDTGSGAPVGSYQTVTFSDLTTILPVSAVTGATLEETTLNFVDAFNRMVAVRGIAGTDMQAKANGTQVDIYVANSYAITSGFPFATGTVKLANVTGASLVIDSWNTLASLQPQTYVSPGAFFLYAPSVVASGSQLLERATRVPDFSVHKLSADYGHIRLIWDGIHYNMQNSNYGMAIRMFERLLTLVSRPVLTFQ